MDLSIATALQEALEALTDPSTFEEQHKRSLQNCHFSGTFSLWVTPTLRSFMTEGDSPATAEFDNDCPHQHNALFLIHNHRYKLLSVPLEGTQANVLYEERPIGEDASLREGEMYYQKYKYFSAILSPDGEARHEPLGRTRLKRIGYAVNHPWTMETEEIHRVVWNGGGGITALLRECRDPNSINTEPTDAYLVSTASEWPCPENLYLPISLEDFERLRCRLKSAIENYSK
jgi:hypothetical protein